MTIEAMGDAAGYLEKGSPAAPLNLPTYPTHLRIVAEALRNEAARGTAGAKKIAFTMSASLQRRFYLVLP